jgi:hypothetical protein
MFKVKNVWRYTSSPPYVNCPLWASAFCGSMAPHFYSRWRWIVSCPCQFTSSTHWLGGCKIQNCYVHGGKENNLPTQQQSNSNSPVFKPTG